MKMKKIYRMLLAIVLMGTMTTAEAQTNGFNRLKNVDTQHVANLAGGMHFAPDVTMDEAHALPGTVAYAAFEDNKVTQLSAQGIDVVNVIVPTMKAMIKENFDEQTYYALRDSAVARVKSSMSGVMGTMLVGHINKFTYDDFKNWVDEIDATMYYEATDKGYRLYFNSPKFPLNAGDLQSYFVGKVNSALSVYRGTLQEMAYNYLADYEEMLPAVFSMLSHFRFEDRFYLTEQTGEGYEKNFGFANSLDYEQAKSVWEFCPVNKEADFMGIKGQYQDANGKWYASFAAGFGIVLSEGMNAYYAVDEIDAPNSLIRRVKVEDGIVPAFTPVIMELNGEDAALNKVDVVVGTGSQPYSDNVLQLATTEQGFLLGRMLEAPDAHYYVLGEKDGKVGLVPTQSTFLRPNEGYLYLADSKVRLNTSGILVLADDVDGIEQVTSSNPSSAVIYDLQGRRVEKPTKGLYIVNGKKVVLQ